MQQMLALRDEDLGMPTELIFFIILKHNKSKSKLIYLILFKQNWTSFTQIIFK